MGYRIHYAQEMIKETIVHEREGTHSYAVLWCLICMCILLYAVYAHHENLLPIIYPGNPEVTKEALSGFLESIGEGASFKAAFADFCFKIICSAG